MPSGLSHLEICWINLLAVSTIPQSTQPSTLRGTVQWVPTKGRGCSAAGKVTAGLAESNGSLPLGGWFKSHAGWQDQLRAQRSVTSMGSLNFFQHHQSGYLLLISVTLVFIGYMSLRPIVSFGSEGYCLRHAAWVSTLFSSVSGLSIVRTACLLILTFSSLLLCVPFLKFILHIVWTTIDSIMFLFLTFCVYLYLRYCLLQFCSHCRGAAYLSLATPVLLPLHQRWWEVMFSPASVDI